MALDWTKCAAVESVPGKVSGAWVFRGTRLPVATIFENLEDGLSIEEIRSEEHTSELQSHSDLVCRLLLEKKNTRASTSPSCPTTITTSPEPYGAEGTHTRASNA